jgi:uncharacterized repeat protein (TIGR03803 family)
VVLSIDGPGVRSGAAAFQLNLFGTAYNGGDIADCYDACGVIYELMPQEGGGWANPLCITSEAGQRRRRIRADRGARLRRQGHFFGTTVKGGAVVGKDCGCGVVYEFTP